MKKYSILLISASLIVVLLVYSLFNMGDKKVEAIDTQTFVYELQDKDIESKLSIKKEWLKEHYALSSLSQLENEHIFYFCVEDNKMKQVKAKVKAFCDKLHQQDPKLKWKEYEKEDVYIMVISVKANTIMEQLKKR